MTALASLKHHLNLNDDADDALLADKLAAAEAYTTRQMGSTVAVTWDTAPADLKQAILMLASWWFEQRESAMVGINAYTVPFGYSEIVLSHREWSF